MEKKSWERAKLSPAEPFNPDRKAKIKFPFKESLKGIGIWKKEGFFSDAFLLAAALSSLLSEDCSTYRGGVEKEGKEDDLKNFGQTQKRKTALWMPSGLRRLTSALDGLKLRLRLYV